MNRRGDSRDALPLPAFRLPRVVAGVVGTAFRWPKRWSSWTILLLLLDEMCETFIALLVGMDAEALHGAIAAWDGAIGHRPHEHVGDLGHQRRKVPKGVVRRPRLRMAKCGSGLAAWTRSGNFIASWMKKTGMLLPTRSQLPSSV